MKFCQFTFITNALSDTFTLEKCSILTFEKLGQYYFFDFISNLSSFYILYQMIPFSYGS